MLDFSWPELFVCLVVAILAIGPKDMPHMMTTLGRVVRRLQYVRYAFSQQFEDFMKEHDLEELRRGARSDIAFDEEKADEEFSAKGGGGIHGQ